MRTYIDDDRGERWRHAFAVLGPVLDLADPAYLGDIRAECEAHQLRTAVQNHDTVTIFDWLLEKAQYQGMADANVDRFAAANGQVSWHDLAAEMDAARCTRLSSYWRFEGCGYRKFAATCSEPRLLAHCPVPRHPFRNGRLSQGAYSLFLFVKDVCDRDLVGWIDQRLAAADVHDHARRSQLMRSALLEPLGNVHGLGDKILSMALSELLLGGDPERERWMTTGASMIAIDTLVHNFLHRTGILRKWGGEHPYGPACYQKDGCADVIEEICGRIDARTINPEFPACFPRFIQHAIWRFCAASHYNICNGNRVDDRRGCQSCFCPAFADCDQLPLHGKVQIQ